MTTILQPQEGAQEVALLCDADVVLYGGSAGSGKSYLLLLKLLMGTDDPNFNGIIFRRTTTTLRDGLWGEAKQLYKAWKPRIQEQPMRMEFNTGAVIKFNHLEYDKNAEMDHQGKQYSLVAFDEACQFSEYQVTYLMSRLRSAAEGNSQLFCTMNPDPDSFMREWVDWWIDEEGYPIPERSGVKRYFCRHNGEMKFADTKEELKERFPEALKVWNPLTKKYVEVEPKSMVFINGTIFDNPALIAANPQYLAELNSLPEIEKARLLHGNWDARPEGANYFDRKWLKKADSIPLNAVSCRAWDKASTEPSDVNTHPDYTASTKMYKSKDGFFYIVGNYHPDIHDKKDPDVLGKFRERPGARDTLILKQAKYDGADCAVVFSQDPGQAGVTEYQESAKKLIEEGFRVSKDPMPPINSKLSRYTPFSSACENGLVYIVESTFDRKTLEAFYGEHEAFDGERSTRTRKDD